MGYPDFNGTGYGQPPEEPVVEAAPPRERYLLHILLFLLTYASTTYSALDFVSPEGTDIYAHLGRALLFSSLLMFFLSAHEFGHYFAARYHRVDATLPFYIPMPFFLFGTLGAVIRTRSQVPSRKVMFDIGVAGPLAGFVVALAYLIIGMVTMPGIESLYAIHPEYRAMAHLPTYGLHFGGFLLFDLLKSLLVAPGRFFPPMNEIYHYPFLAVGWFGMFVTALNMIPVGQLDGGHVLYGMFGRNQARISRWFVRFLLFVGLGSIGIMLRDATRSFSTDGVSQFLQSLFGPVMEWITLHASWWFDGWIGWLFWVVILRVLVKIEHPPAPDDTPLDRKRIMIGWVALLILVLTFSYTGLYEPDDGTPPPATPQRPAPVHPSPQPPGDGPII